MRGAAESVNAYGALFFGQREGALPPRCPQALEAVSAADLRLIDDFSALSAPDQRAVLRETGTLLGREMRAFSSR